jgi:hypothetical protein
MRLVHFVMFKLYHNLGLRCGSFGFWSVWGVRLWLRGLLHLNVFAHNGYAPLVQCRQTALACCNLLQAT